MLSSVVGQVSVSVGRVFLRGRFSTGHPVRQPALRVQILRGGECRIPAFQLHNLPGASGQSCLFIRLSDLSDFYLAEIVLRIRLPPLTQVKVERRLKVIQLAGIGAVVEALLKAVDPVGRAEAQQGVNLLRRP